MNDESAEGNAGPSPLPLDTVTAAAGPLLTLYSRIGCHLCDDMIALVYEFRKDYNFRLEVVDIDRDPLLKQRFNELVPVLSRDGQEICHHFLDLVALRESLED